MGAVLTLDRGNSTLDCMVWGETPSSTRRAWLEPWDTAGLQRFLAGGCPPRAVGLTVVAGGLDPAQVVLGDLGCPLAQVGRELEVPLQVVYQDPRTLGADRLVAALAAHVEHGRGVVVDLGTAVTVSLVRDGVFLGGAIAPGPVAMARGLHASAPALPRVDLAAAIRLPAESSADAVNAGVVVGFCSLVDGLVRAVAAAADLESAPHLLTGGQAGLYLEASGPQGGGLPFVHVPDLIHRGLRWLASAAT